MKNRELNVGKNALVSHHKEEKKLNVARTPNYRAGGTEATRSKSPVGA